MDAIIQNWLVLTGAFQSVPKTEHSSTLPLVLIITAWVNMALVTKKLEATTIENNIYTQIYRYYNLEHTSEAILCFYC